MHPSRSSPIVVGRVAERLVVQRFLETVGSRQEALVIAGEAGMGKTTLWSDAVRTARARGVDVLTCRATEDAWSRPGLGLHELFGSATETDRGAELDVERVVARLRDLLSRGPVLLAVDDLQWLDMVSWTVLRRALWRMEAEPTAVLATVRTWSPMYSAETDPDLLRLGSVLNLAPMNVDEIGELLADLTIPRSELRRLHQLSGGNPMFAAELHRTRKEPSTGTRLLQVIAQRFSNASPATTELIEILAVAGPVEADTLCRALEVKDVDAAVMEASALGVVTVDDDFTVRFTHPLFATAALAGTNALGLRHVHARLAEVSEDPALRLVHRSRATMGVDPELADDLAEMATGVAARGAHDMAADLRAQSARLTETIELRRARQLDQAFSLAASGQVRESVVIVESVLADTRISTPLRIRAIAQHVFLDFEGSEEFLRTALVNSVEDRLTAVLKDLLAWQLGLYRGRLAEALSVSEQAVELSQSVGDVDTGVKASCTLAVVALLMGRPRPEVLEEAVSMGDTLQLSELGRWPRVFRGRCHLWNGDLAAARRDLEGSERMASHLHSEFQKPYRFHDKALLELASGDVLTAERAAREGIEAATAAGNHQASIWLAYPLGLCAALRGATEGAARASQALIDWSVRSRELPRPAMAQDIEGTDHASRGEWGAALKAWREAAGLLRGLGYRHPGPLPVLPRAAEAAARLGDADVCRALADELLEQSASLVGAPWVHHQAEAANASAVALDGDTDALHTLADAVAGLEELGYRLDAARWQLVLASIASRQGQSEVARSAVVSCRPLLEQMGLGGWIRPEQAVLDASGDFTPTEQQVAMLVGDGLRNSDIAARLFLSVSTIEAHLTRMYRKLGVRSRAGLVAHLENPQKRRGH